MYSKYGITFDSVGEPSFDNCTVRNVITFGADSSSSSHSYNSKNNILILGDAQLLELMEYLVHQREKV